MITFNQRISAGANARRTCRAVCWIHCWSNSICFKASCFVVYADWNPFQFSFRFQLKRVNSLCFVYKSHIHIDERLINSWASLLLASYCCCWLDHAIRVLCGRTLYSALEWIRRIVLNDASWAAHWSGVETEFAFIQHLTRSLNENQMRRHLDAKSVVTTNCSHLIDFQVHK